MVQQQYGRLEINFSLKKPKTPYKTLAVQECFYSAGPLSTETTEIHRVSIKAEKWIRSLLGNIITTTNEIAEPSHHTNYFIFHFSF